MNDGEHLYLNIKSWSIPGKISGETVMSNLLSYPGLQALRFIHIFFLAIMFNFLEFKQVLAVIDYCLLCAIFPGRANSSFFCCSLFTQHSSLSSLLTYKLQEVLFVIEVNNVLVNNVLVMELYSIPHFLDQRMSFLNCIKKVCLCCYCC